MIYGKSYTKNFKICICELEDDQRRDDYKKFLLRVCHVGDSVHHNVAKDDDSGILRIFIVGEIHDDELLSKTTSGDVDGELLAWRAMWSKEILEQFFDREGITPTHVLSVFNY